MDGKCHLQDRAELVQILDNHKLWLMKYASTLGAPAAPDAQEALRDPLRADLSSAQLLQGDLTGADLVYANLSQADLTGAVLAHADLTSADLEGTDLTSADLEGANLIRADLTCAYPGAEVPKCAYLGDADLSGADLTGADLSEADLTGADLNGADLTCAGAADGKQTCVNLTDADLSNADLGAAQLIGADLGNAKLPGAHLSQADLTGANLRGAGASNASLVQADLSSAIIQQTDLSGADFTLAKLWYADFEPKAPPLLGTIPPGEGLETVRWSVPGDFNNELDYRLRVEQAQQSKGLVAMPPVPHHMRDRWLVWLSCYRERLDSGKDIPLEDAVFLVTDVLLGFQPHGPRRCASLEGVATGQSYEGSSTTASSRENSDASEASTLAQYQLMDIRTAAQSAGHPEVALEVNIAIQRHTQHFWKMIAFDWTCAYGAAPDRPIVLAGLLALMALPFYWFGFRRQWRGVRLFRVEDSGKKEEEIPKGGRRDCPKWRMPLGVKRTPQSRRRLRLLTRLHLKRPTHGLRLFLASRMPRVRWEASFLKAVFLFSLISVIDLGFDGFDFGRWVRMLFFTEYDLKARGWLRFVSGLQSLIGLGLLALALLSFFGHPFD
jgi:uncharacterized protein YjbI with pentapeptide repeats